MEKITIKEIAKKAGVSIGTVDRVLHNRGEVAERTKKQVLKIAREGNYQTNLYARNLKLNRRFTLAVLIPEDNEYWKDHNNGLRAAVSPYESMGLQLQQFTFDRHDLNSFLFNAQNMLKSNPSGVIMAPLIEEEVLKITQQLDEQGTPYVFVDSNLASANPISFIGQDSTKAGYLSAKLLNLGYPSGHKTYIVRFDDFDSLNKTIEERISGFKKYYQDRSYSDTMIHEVHSHELSDLLENHNVEEWIHLFVPNSRIFELNALLAKKNTNTRSIGFDLIEENIQCLKNDQIDFIINQNPFYQGELAIQTFYKKLVLDTETEKQINIPLEIVTRENLP